MRTLFRHFFAFLLVFLLAKLVFIAYNAGSAGEAISAADVCQILWHGLTLDLATCAYFSAPLWLAGLLGVWLSPYIYIWSGAKRTVRILYATYLALLAAATAVALVVDTALYAFWGFKLDATVLNYLDHGLSGATQSVSLAFCIGAVCAILLSAAAIFAWVWLSVRFKRRGTSHEAAQKCGIGRKALLTGAYLLLGGILFLCIRGGVGKSTANVGKAYFSERQFLNHAAVNPVFSFCYSLGKRDDYARRYHYFTAEEVQRRIQAMGYGACRGKSDLPSDGSAAPNVVVILMEGMGAQFWETLGGGATAGYVRQPIAPNLCREAANGLLFTHCYANSFRTDRGTVSALSGYPAFPDLSVMKVPARSRSLPSLARSLVRAGYVTEFIYGGDIDFTNMRSYFLSTGYQTLFSETHFPLATRRTHAWGVTDEITLDTLYAHIQRLSANAAQPYHIGYLSLASHEPWEVPYSRIQGDEIANAMAYIDDALGRFLSRLRQSPAWQNLLLVILPDHGIQYPADMQNGDPRRIHIPLLLTGGWVTPDNPRLASLAAPDGTRLLPVATVCNQSDMPATVLALLGLPHDDFRFSRDILSPAYTAPVAFHTYSGGLTVLTPTDTLRLDLNALSGSHPDRAVQTGSSPHAASLLPDAKAYLQAIHEDLAAENPKQNTEKPKPNPEKPRPKP